MTDHTGPSHAEITTELKEGAPKLGNSIIDGGQWPPNPRVGDFPPFAPYGPYTPIITAPSTGANGFLTPPKENTMDIFIIWAIVPDQPDAPWVVAAWDSESIAQNEDGWLEKLADAEEVFGGRFVRVTKSEVNYDKVVSAFRPTEV